MSAVIRFAQFPLYQNSLKPLLWQPGFRKEPLWDSQYLLTTTFNFSVNFFYPYFMRLKEARELTGLSTKTLLPYIKQGKVKAVLVGSGQHRRWEIDPESLEQIERRPPKDDHEDYQESSV
jgi:hypothetical protein